MLICLISVESKWVIWYKLNNHRRINIPITRKES
jgi:hypothetical protein